MKYLKACELLLILCFLLNNLYFRKFCGYLSNKLLSLQSEKV